MPKVPWYANVFGCGDSCTTCEYTKIHLIVLFFERGNFIYDKWSDRSEIKEDRKSGHPDRVVREG